MSTLIVLLGLLAAAAAVPAYSSHDKTLVYKYSADVKAGAMQPANFASQFGIECLLAMRATSDPTLKNSYQLIMSDVKFGLNNGEVQHFEHVKCMQPVVDEAKALETPFLVVFDDNGRLQSIRVHKDESKWSLNMKKAIASALQLDLANIKMESPMKPHSFISHEDTIHGRCQVAYDVHPPKTDELRDQNVFVVTKMHEPKNCSHFMHFEHNHVEHEQCFLPEENGMTTASRRVFELVNQGRSILVKKLIAHGVINYIPHMANDQAHYVLSNQTFILDDTIPENDPRLGSFVNVNDLPNMHSLIYSQPDQEYVPQAGMDVTNGRHVVNLDHVVTKLRKMLAEAADYMKENQIKEKAEDWKHGQIINRIMHAMNLMDVGAFDRVFSMLQDVKESRQATMMRIFLGIVPNVGTTASCLFTQSVVRRKAVSDRRAVMMLSVLPMHVQRPTHELLKQMEPLLRIGDTVDLKVRRASVLCFATLIRKTFMNEQSEINNNLLNEYLNQFMNHITGDSSPEMKTLYMMAMKNVGLWHILRHLEPIIKGEFDDRSNPHIRVQAIWAIRSVVVNRPNYAHNLLWPILSNVKLPVSLRIVAYDVLMNQLPHTARFMNMYWFMVYEKNEHLYNYHLNTIRGIANSVDPCLVLARETARKILRFTRIRHVPGPLSTKLHFDYMNEKFNYGESIKSSLILNPRTGLPEIGCAEHFTSAARKPSARWGIHWFIEGMAEMMKDLKKDVWGKMIQTINHENMRKMLDKAANNAPRSAEININLMLTFNNHVVTMFHANKNDWKELLEELKDWKNLVNKYINDLNWETVFYDNHYEMHVATDNGLPVTMFTRMPSVDSLKIHAVPADKGNSKNLQLQMKHVGWKHGEYAMSIYNPIADVWHSIRKTAALDIAASLDMNAVYTSDTKNLQITLPRLPMSEHSIGGILTSAKSFVTVTDDKANPIKGSCHEINHYTLVTNNVDKKEFRMVTDSKDTGLQHTMLIHHCENTLVPVMPMDEFFEVYQNVNKNPLNNWPMKTIMMARQMIMNNLISSQGATCSNLIRIEPSIKHPTSALELTGKINIENYVDDKMHVLNSKRIDVRGTMVAKAASTNEPVRHWNANLNVYMNQGHVNNTMKATITRSGWEEKNLKMCIDAQKDFPIIHSDILKIDPTMKETTLKMKISMGETKDDKCVHDDLDLTILVKGHLSEEQRNRMRADKINGTCIKDIHNPLLNPEGSHVPKSWGCMNEAMLHSTLRRYTWDIVSRKASLPMLLHSLQDFSNIFWQQTDPRNLRLAMEFPVLSSSLNMFLITPSGEHHLIKLPLGHPVWNILMDNTHFSFPAMIDNLNSNFKVCTIYLRMLLNFDNGTIPMNVLEEWTLLAGDYTDKSFAVAVREVGNSKMDVKIMVGEHWIEIINSHTGIAVNVDNNKVADIERGTMVPPNQPDTYSIRLTKNYEHMIVDSRQVPLMVAHTPTSVTIVLGTEFQGQVSGICGNMDGSHFDVLPAIHTAANL